MTDQQKIEKYAEDLVNSHYVVLFDSESDKGEEILVSLLARKAALVSIDFLLSYVDSLSDILFLKAVRDYIEKQ